MINFSIDDALENKPGDKKMNPNQNTQVNLIDTTDCLEAVGVCRSWKNFFFTLAFLSLLLLQVAFWLVKTGVIDTAADFDTQQIQEQQDQMVVTEQQVDLVVNEIIPQEQINDQIDDPNATAKASKSNKNVVSGDKLSVKDRLEFFRNINTDQLAWMIKFLNLILVLSAVLYCLSILIVLKISMVGRFGGINHICRALFLATTLLVLIIPWQVIFKDIIVGIVYTPTELANSCSETENASTITHILFYLRYCAYWLVGLLILINSQIRSGKWTNAILRRLEVV